MFDWMYFAEASLNLDKEDLYDQFTSGRSAEISPPQLGY